jgi:hypothetical protein
VSNRHIGPIRIRAERPTLFARFTATVKIVLAAGQADPHLRLIPVMGVLQLICRLFGS